MKKNDVLKRHNLLLVCCLYIVSCLLVPETSLAQSVTKESVARAISPHAKNNRFPGRLPVQGDQGQVYNGIVNYTFDARLHQDMAKVYLKYQPDYACFVAIDVDTGAIINLTSFVKEDEPLENLVLRADYPAASVFKIVTAAAGLDLGKVSPSTVIPFNGKSTSLYKSQVLRHKTTKWTRTPTLKESFAKSINAVFGQIGVFRLGADNLSKYAKKFGFDQQLITDFELPESRIELSFMTDWEIAEAASGYTRQVKLSPIHAAQLAATIVNDGKMVVPYMVDKIADERGRTLYQHVPAKTDVQVISSSAANAMRTLMVETPRIGSARGSFRDIKRYKIYRDMEIGGKTGSLTGFSPKGRHDWFVGYAEKDGRRIAYASLVVNKEKWYVRSAYVARQFIYHYFSNLQEQEEQIAKTN